MLQYSGLLPEGVSEKIQNEAKEQSGGFLSILLGTLGASLLGSIWTGKEINRAEEEFIRAGYETKKVKKQEKKKTTLWKRNCFFIAHYPLKNFEIQKYYKKMSIDLRAFILEITYLNATSLKLGMRHI